MIALKARKANSRVLHQPDDKINGLSRSYRLIPHEVLAGGRLSTTRLRELQESDENASSCSADPGGELYSMRDLGEERVLVITQYIADDRQLAAAQRLGKPITLITELLRGLKHLLNSSVTDISVTVERACCSCTRNLRECSADAGGGDDCRER